MNAGARSEPDVMQVVPFLAVSDMQRSLRLYVDGLGFNMTDRWVDDGTIRWCRLQRGGAAVMLQDFRRDGGGVWSPGGTLGLGVSIMFICSDAVLLYEEFVARGVAASRPFVGNGMWVTTVRDPDGYVVEFESPTGMPEGTELGDGPTGPVV